MNLPKLLIIDDESDICDLIVDIAEVQGFAASSISDPTEVESHLRNDHPDCILMDLMMPGIDGVELLRNLSEAIKDCAIILMSGHDSRVLNSAKRLGAAHGLNILDVLEKPLDVPMLRQKLELFKQAAGKETTRKNDVAQDELTANQLVVHYQPIITMDNGKLKGVEALARWQHPTHGLLGPAEFLDKLDAGGMKTLTLAVIKQAVRDTALLQTEGHAPVVSINFTHSNLVDDSILDTLLSECQKRGLPPDRVNIEITEGEMMQDAHVTIEILKQLRLKGFGLAIDDFGIGYSCLRELQRLPLNIMKMDKSFVMELASNHASKTIVHAIIELGHNLGLKVVAEGVETQDSWSYLKDNGCDMAQGYYISRPIAFAPLQAWLRANAGLFAG